MFVPRKTARSRNYGEWAGAGDVQLQHADFEGWRISGVLPGCFSSTQRCPTADDKGGETRDADCRCRAHDLYANATSAHCQAVARLVAHSVAGIAALMTITFPQSFPGILPLRPSTPYKEVPGEK